MILCMCPANEGRRDIVMSSLIGWMHSQNNPWLISSIIYDIFHIGHGADCGNSSITKNLKLDYMLNS